MLSLGDITIITVKDIDYWCTISDISKSGTTNLLENYVHDDQGFI